MNVELRAPRVFAVALLPCLLLVASAAYAATPDTTSTFKTVDQPDPYPDLDMKIDIYGAYSANASRPIVMNIHGGALMFGDRTYSDSVDGVIRERFP